jgi:hypothetical protein
MLTELCQELKNWFECKKMFGTFTIEDGQIVVPNGSLQNGQFFRIVGSTFNDGVHQYPVEDLINETFTGAIWLMTVPPAVVALSERITEWTETYGGSVSSPYSSESFGGYSYTKASSGQGNATWKSTFADELNRWRKI